MNNYRLTSRSGQRFTDDEQRIANDAARLAAEILGRNLDSSFDSMRAEAAAELNDGPEWQTWLLIEASAIGRALHGWNRIPEDISLTRG